MKITREFSWHRNTSDEWYLAPTEDCKTMGNYYETALGRINKTSSHTYHYWGGYESDGGTGDKYFKTLKAAKRFVEGLFL